MHHQYQLQQLVARDDCHWSWMMMDQSHRPQQDRPAYVKSKGKGFPCSIPSVGPVADPGVQAVSPQVTVSHPPSGRLPLLSATPAVTSPASQHHRPLAGTKLYCLVTEAHRREQLAQGCYAASPRAGFELATYWSQAQTPYPLHHHATLHMYASININLRMHEYTMFILTCAGQGLCCITAVKWQWVSEWMAHQHIIGYSFLKDDMQWFFGR